MSILGSCPRILKLRCLRSCPTQRNGQGFAGTLVQLVLQVVRGLVSRCLSSLSRPRLAYVSALSTKQRLLLRPHCRLCREGGQSTLPPTSSLRLTCVSMPLRSLGCLLGPLSNQFERGLPKGFLWN